MSVNDPRPQSSVIPPASTGGGGLYLLVGALLVGLLVGGYFLVGAPGLHTDIAQAPARNAPASIEHIPAPAPAAPVDPATPRR